MVTNRLSVALHILPKTVQLLLALPKPASTTRGGELICVHRRLTDGRLTLVCTYKSACVCMRDAAPRSAAYRRKSVPRMKASSCFLQKIRLLCRLDPLCENKQRQHYEGEQGPAAAAFGQIADHERVEPRLSSVRIDAQLGTHYLELRRIGQAQLQVRPVNIERENGICHIQGKEPWSHEKGR